MTLSKFATMHLSQKGLDLIKQFESFVPIEYLCPGNIWTIGYGHALKAGEKYTKITENEAEELLKQDVKVAEFTVNTSVKTILTQNQFDALVSLVFNWGSGNFLRSKLLKNLNSDNYDGVISEFKTIIKANGKVLPGLERRRDKEIKLFLQRD